ncbi:Ger(x)C family spore germination protein [Gracilibacillus sp. YIM 98692]|uniref:Ger(x)C family spore germination protein n=1 Tax=Gracilibacillus sp. YIM 98692 TaxID=2663532 RepID=UPI0013D58420|nr:Ger(x)C family spore germination protein [Gracilibacillus sp. YIM 98692]
MKRILLLIVICLLGVLSACVQKQILDDVQLVTAIGYELTNENELKATAVTPIYKPDKTIISDIFTETGPLSKEIRKQLNMQSSRPFVSGKIEIGLYSKDLAQKGMLDLLDTFYRDPAVGSRAYLAIVDGNMQSLLEKQYGQQDNGIYLSHMFEQNIDTGSLPRTNLNQFLSAYYSQGIDPFIPIVKQENGQVKLDGHALFRGDKMVGELSAKNMFIFKVLMDKYTKQDSTAVKLTETNQREGEYVSVLKIRAKRVYKIENTTEVPKITINVKIEGNVEEYSEGQQIDKKIIKTAQKSMQSQVKKQADDMISMFQELRIDPIGIGGQVRSRQRNWDENHWLDVYPNADINVDVQVSLTETGIVE